MTLDGTRNPVLHFTDTNQPGDVTGYNVYRTSLKSLPKQNWPQMAVNVVDMDPAAPDYQWIDTSGQEPPGPDNLWFYQLTAYNGAPCDAEGPFD